MALLTTVFTPHFSRVEVPKNERPCFLGNGCRNNPYPCFRALRCGATNSIKEMNPLFKNFLQSRVKIAAVVATIM